MLLLIGYFSFGAVIGWCAGLAVQNQSKFGISHLAALFGAVGGGAVTGFFSSQEYFGTYAIGLGISFFLQRFIAYGPVQDMLKKELGKD